MSNRKILFIVEGKSESKFLNQSFFKFLNIDDRYNIIEYKTSIYELYDLLIKFEDESLTSILFFNGKLDIRLKDNRQLNSTFSYIYLIFDLDIQYHKFDEKKIIYMANRFNEATEEGQLLLNFPMFESIYDIHENFPITDTYKFVDVLKSADYKNYVKSITFNKENNHIYKTISSSALLLKIASFNLKRYLLINKLYAYTSINVLMTLKNILNKYYEINKIFVLNMMILLTYEFKINDDYLLNLV